MLKKLRIKFVVINMFFVTVILCVMFGIVLKLTKSNLEAESIRMMQSVVENPYKLERPEINDNQVRLPFFSIQINEKGEVLAKGGSYFDLSNEEFIAELIQASFANNDKTGIIDDYGLRYLKADVQGRNYLVFADTSIENITIESPEDLSEYGLDEPVLTITAKADRDIVINVGNSNMDGQKYITIGDGNVYLVSSTILSTFSYGLYDIVKMETVPSMADMNNLSITRNIGTLDIMYADDTDWAYSAEYVWFLTEGEKHTALDTELTNDLTNLVTGLSWSDCVEYNASAEKLTEYGFDNPAAVVTVDYSEDVNVATDETDEDGNVIYETAEEDRTFVLEIGNTVDSYAYARISGSNMIYTIPSSTAEAFMYTTRDELLPDEILCMDWDLVDTVDITLDGESYHVEKQINEETDDEGNVTQETVYVLNGEEIDIMGIFDGMTSLVSTGSVAGAVEESAMEIGFVFNRSTESFAQVELIFYQHDSTSCLVSLNGETRLLIARSDVASLIEDISAVIK